MKPNYICSPDLAPKLLIFPEYLSHTLQILQSELLRFTPHPYHPEAGPCPPNLPGQQSCHTASCPLYLLLPPPIRECKEEFQFTLYLSVLFDSLQVYLTPIT